MSTLGEKLRRSSREGMITSSELLAIALESGLDTAGAERQALLEGIVPERYLRNSSTISVRQQLALLDSTAVVVGCGGLGGYAIEELARLGTGKIIAIDPDVFEEHNLNRQILSDITRMGKSKADAAVERVAEVNPSVRAISFPERFTGKTADRHLSGATVVIDALDSISVRLDLADACRALAIPLVHGAIAGWYGQVAIQYPGESTIEALFSGSRADRGIEERLGNPAFTPAFVASLQVAEACKIILGLESTLRGHVLMIDLYSLVFETIPAGKPAGPGD